MRRRRVLAGLGLLAVPLVGRAQLARVMPDTSQHVLQPPPAGQPLLCHERTILPDSLRARGFSVWEFEAGAPTAGPVALHPREITVGFDSAGVPVLLTDIVTLLPIRTDQVVLRFVRGREPVGHWRAVRFDSASVARMEAAARSGGRIADAIPPAQVRELTADEQRRARVLAQLLWERRCPRR